MSKIEKLRKKPVEVETMLWDGTPETAEAIQDWTGQTSNEGEWAFLLPDEVTGYVEHAQLYVAHNRSWSPLPEGYRVAKEIDGSGFYPLSPEGAAAADTRCPIMADQPYSEVDVQLVAVAVGRQYPAHRRESLTSRLDGDARAALDALAAAGRLARDGASLLGRGVEFASEHAGHTVKFLADPFIQPTSDDRDLAELRVRSWTGSYPGTHRLVSRDVTTYAGPWTPVDAALQAQDQGSTDE